MTAKERAAIQMPRVECSASLATSSARIDSTDT